MSVLARPAARRARARHAAALAVLAAALAPGALHAQRQPDDRPVPPWERRSAPTFSVGGAGVFAGARSGDGRLDAGGGFDVHAAVGVSALSLGVGYQRTTHDLAGTSTSGTLSGVYVEPRIAVAPFRNFTPYVAGRVAFLTLDAPASPAFAATDASRTQYGGGAGVLVSLAPNVSLDLGAMYTWVAGSGTDGAAATQPFTGGRGGAPLLRAGLVLGFDRWGR